MKGGRGQKGMPAEYWKVGSRPWLKLVMVHCCRNPWVCRSPFGSPPKLRAKDPRMTGLAVGTERKYRRAVQCRPTSRAPGRVCFRARGRNPRIAWRRADHLLRIRQRRIELAEHVAGGERRKVKFVAHTEVQGEA